MVELQHFYPKSQRERKWLRFVLPMGSGDRKESFFFLFVNFSSVHRREFENSKTAAAAAADVLLLLSKVVVIVICCFFRWRSSRRSSPPFWLQQKTHRLPPSFPSLSNSMSTPSPVGVELPVFFFFFFGKFLFSAVVELFREKIVRYVVEAKSSSPLALSSTAWR